MCFPACAFLHPSSLTLLHPASRHPSRLPRTHVAPARISTTFCLATKRRATDSTSSKSRKSSANELGNTSLAPVDFDADDPLHDAEDEEDPGLVEPDEENIAEWAGDSEEEDVPLEDLILSASQADSGLHDDDDDFIGPEFSNDDDDEDEDEDEESDEDDEDDVDDDVGHLSSADEFDAYNEDLNVPVAVKSRSKVASPTIDLSDDEEPDDGDSDDLHVLMEPPSDDIDPLFEGDNDEPSMVDIAAEQDADDVSNETDDEIENAANILSKSGLLGLGNKRTLADTSDSRPVLSPTETQLEEDGDLFDEEDEEDIEGSLDDKKDEEEESEYRDYEDEEDEEGFGAPKTKFGKVWELNDDCYVTITEPGESYAYELDPEDQEDQEMATMRRGKQGGWSGGLASYPSTDLVEGSKEWIARRSYELMTKATAKEMFRWTRWRTDPPDSIKEIFPADPAPAPAFGKVELNQTLPMEGLEGQKPTGKEPSRELAFVDTRDETEESSAGDDAQETALDRSIKFPTTYMFKVEGLGEGFLDSLQRTVEYALNRPVPDLQMEVEPSGRYERVIIRVEVKNSSQVTNIYDALRNNPMVKFSYG